MNLSCPIETLIPSLDSATLSILARTESGLGTSRIRQLAGRGSRQGHQNVLDRLVEHGLVLAEPTNNGYTYLLNRQHILSPLVLAATRIRAELRDRLAGLVDELDPQPIHASVFGSFAREEASPHSDIDLFLVMPDGYDATDDRWETQLQTVENRVLAWTGNHLEVLVLDRSQLRRALEAAEPVLTSIRTEAIVLRGVPVEELLA